MKPAALLALVAMLPCAAAADSLYVSPPAAVAHPLRLGPDHRAAQIGDLLHVQFNFAAQSFSSDVSNNSKQFSLGSSNGSSSQSGIRLLGFLRVPTSLGGQTGTQSSKTENGTTGFTSEMEATVVGVTPSGMLEIAGNQSMIVNGQSQVLHVTGYVRPEDIDSSDSVLSTRIANVQGTFSGNFQSKNVGLIRRVLNWLF